MRITFLAAILLAGVLTVAGPAARAQDQQRPPRLQLSSADLAVTFTTEQSTVTPSNANFWLKGGSLDASTTFFHGFGLAANVTGDFASGIAPNVNLGELSYMAGPRYTYSFHTRPKHEVRIFGEALAGGVKGFDSVFPVSTGISHSATAFSWQVGGGLDIAIWKHFAIRAVEADFVRSNLPNNGTDRENHLRLAFGVTYHTGRP